MQGYWFAFFGALVRFVPVSHEYRKLIRRQLGRLEPYAMVPFVFFRRPSGFKRNFVSIGCHESLEPFRSGENRQP